MLEFPKLIFIRKSQYELTYYIVHVSIGYEMTISVCGILHKNNLCKVFMDHCSLSWQNWIMTINQSIEVSVTSCLVAISNLNWSFKLTPTKWNFIGREPLVAISYNLHLQRCTGASSVSLSNYNSICSIGGHFKRLLSIWEKMQCCDE